MPSRHDVVIVGAGLAGLSAARNCTRAGLNTLLLESADVPGGRVATDVVEGFQLDRGFQVLLDSYPEARQALDVPALDLRPFAPGALVWRGSGFAQIADPWRDVIAGVHSLVSGVFSPGDAWRMLRLRRDALQRLRPAPVERGAVTTADALAARGFSERALNGFFRPFFGGVFLDPELGAPVQWFEFLFAMFAVGRATLPAAGMRAIPLQLAAALPGGVLRTGQRVRSLREGKVELASGETIETRTVVLATDARQAAVLAPGIGAPAWAGCTTLYYAAPRSPLDRSMLVLDGESRRGPINHVCVPSDIAPSYAPAGQALISATALGTQPHDDAALDRAARAQLARWFGGQVQEWRLLRASRVAHALPRLLPQADARAETLRLAPSLYACGDYLETPSINGALRSGRRAAETLLDDLGVARPSGASA